MHAQNQLRDTCCHLADMIQDIDKKCAVPDVIMSPAITLVLVIIII